MKYPPVQVLEAPRPSNAPADFIDWQFAFYKARILSEELEDQLCQLLTKLLMSYLPQHFGKPLRQITRAQAQAVADDINEHSPTILNAMAYLLTKAQEESQ